MTSSRTDAAKKARRVPYHFGEKLRRVREHQGLTLKAVADRAGVSESLVSQIECNKVSPAIDTLLALVDVLDVNLEFLFEEYRRQHSVQVVRRDERRALMEEDVLFEELATPVTAEKKNMFESYAIRIPAGSHTHRGSYGHVGQEFGVITKGACVLKYERKEYELCEGDSVSFPAGSAHVLENRTDTDVEAVWTVTPPQRFVN